VAQHAVRVEVGGGAAAALGLLVGHRRRRGGREHDAVDPLGCGEAELHGDEAPHAEADDRRPGDAERVEKLEHRVGEATHRHDLRQGRRRAVARQVRRDHAELVGERLHLPRPHGAAERMPVDEDDRRARPAVVVRERRRRHPGQA
jgi:hypothetical protein